MLQQIRPNLEDMKRIFAKAVKHSSDGAKYFQLMLKVLASEKFLENEVFLVFQDLFNRQQLANCRNTIMNTEGRHFARDDLCLRSMPPSLE